MKRFVVFLVVVAAAYFGLRASGLLPAELSGRSAPSDATSGEIVANELVTEAETLHDAGNHAESAVLYRKASEEAAAAGDDVLALAYRAQSGVCLKKAGQTTEAFDIMEAALAEARERGVRRVEGLALGNLARLHDLEGRPEQGLALRDELVDFALEEGDERLAVWTLEQAAASALGLGDPAGAIARIDRALPYDANLESSEQRTAPLRRQRAWALVQQGDDEGATLAWEDVDQSGASMANRAQHLALLGMHIEAAEVAHAAAELLERDGAAAAGDRDRALLLWLGELIHSQQIEKADVALFQLLPNDENAGAEVGGDGREVAEAPFRVMLARVAVSQGRFEDALTDLDRARAVLEREIVEPDDVARLAAVADQAFELDALRVTALVWLERYDDALGVLEAMSPSQARGALMAWLCSRHRDRAWTALNVLDELEPTPAGLDGTVARLRKTLPFDFPTVGGALLDATLVDLARMREEAGEGVEPAGASELLARGVRLALIWQALEQIDEVTGLDPVPMFADIERIERWVAGDLAPGSAVVSLITGDGTSSLVMCVAGRPVTTFGISPPTRLQTLVGGALEGLRSLGVDGLAMEARTLTKEILPKPALEDLRDTTHVTFILPGAIGTYPPAAYVLEEPVPLQPVSWLAYRFVVSQLPHALAGGSGAATVDAERREWLRVGEPAVDTAAASFVTDYLETIYGDAALQPTRLRRAEDEPAITGADASATGLREALPHALALELSAPAFGGGRLGGVLLAPSEEAQFGDERGGFLPWHRWPDLPLPPVVIADRARFGPAPGQTPDIAATALMARSQAVLLTRWPSPVEPELMLRRIIENLRGGLALGEAVTGAQRDFLLLTRDDLSNHHPRNWAPWLAYATR